MELFYKSERVVGPRSIGSSRCICITRRWESRKQEMPVRRIWGGFFFERLTKIQYPASIWEELSERMVSLANLEEVIKRQLALREA